MNRQAFCGPRVGGVLLCGSASRDLFTLMMTLVIRPVLPVQSILLSCIYWFSLRTGIEF